MHGVLEAFLPKDTLTFFTVVNCRSDDENTYITLEEKDNTPNDNNGNPVTKDRILARKFHDITVADFPIRGKRSLLTFRRRYWKIKDQKEYLKRDIQLSHPGTKLQTEFAAFLKEKGRDKSPLAVYYSRVP